MFTSRPGQAQKEKDFLSRKREKGKIYDSVLSLFRVFVIRFIFF